MKKYVNIILRQYFRNLAELEKPRKMTCKVQSLSSEQILVAANKWLLTANKWLLAANSCSEQKFGAANKNGLTAMKLPLQRTVAPSKSQYFLKIVLVA